MAGISGSPNISGIPISCALFSGISTPTPVGSFEISGIVNETILSLSSRFLSNDGYTSTTVFTHDPINTNLVYSFIMFNSQSNGVGFRGLITHVDDFNITFNVGTGINDNPDGKYTCLNGVLYLYL